MPNPISRTLSRSTPVGLAAVCLAGTISAQQSDTTAQTPRDSMLPLARLAPIVITGTAVPHTRGNVGLATYVVTGSEIEALRPFNASEALKALPGSFINEAVGPGGPANVQIRGGEEVFTQILMDGVQVNQNGGFFDFQGFPLTNVERIEVVRGPQSVLYGSSAVSGAVQFVTARGFRGPPKFEFTAEGGTAQNAGDSFRSAGTVRGGTRSLLYSGGIGLSHNRGIYDVAHDTRTRDVSLRIDAKPGSAWDINTMFRFIGVESNLPVRDPGATRIPLDSNARDERDRFVGSLAATFRPLVSWTNKLGVALYREDFLFEDEFDNVAESGDYDFFAFDANFVLDSRLWRTTADYVGSHSLAPTPGWGLDVSYGGRIEHEDLEDQTSGDFGDSQLQLDRSNLAGFGELQADLHRHMTLLVGMRLDKYQGLSAEWTPRASARLSVIPEVFAVRIALGRAYKAPNLQQQYLDNPFIVSNPDLAPETSTSWEVGSTLDILDDALAIELTYFRQQFRDLIQLTPVEGEDRLTYQNLSTSLVQGVEGTLRYSFGQNLAVGLDGTWLHARITDNAGLAPAGFPLDSALPYRPDLTGRVFVQWVPLQTVSTTLFARHVGSQIVLSERFSGRRVEMEPYTLLGLVLELALTRRWAAHARMGNLFGVEYDTAFDRPGIPRNFAVGLRVRN